MLFGLYIFVTNGPSAATEFYAGYITEEALSVDNLFVFMIIMGTFRVARENQQKVLLFGIVFAILARGTFIFAGAAIINSFAWVFYIFGLVQMCIRDRNTIRARAGRLRRPSSSSRCSPNSATVRASTASPGSMRDREMASASTRNAPCSTKREAMVLLPLPIPPVRA